MAVSPASWLVDKSVLARLGRPEVRQVVLPRVQAGPMAITVVTELEVGFSARSARDYATAGPCSTTWSRSWCRRAPSSGPGRYRPSSSGGASTAR
jgi:hypothetical protein